MKKYPIIFTFLFFVFNSQAQPNIFIPGYDKEIDDEAMELFSPYETVHSGRELPRTFTVPYPDEQSARDGSLSPSLYLQPMDETPEKNDTGDHIEYSWKYKVPFAWVGRMVSVYIGSVDNPYSVLVNGQLAGNNQSSRSAAEFDITALSEEGVNTLTIRVEKNPAARVLSAATGTGKITGKVLVKSQPRIRVRDYVYELNLNGEDPVLQLGIILKTQYLNPRSVRLHYSLRDRSGTTVASGHRDAEVGLKEEDTVRFLLTVKDFKPWSYETPHIYDLTIKNQYEGRYTEYVNHKTGFRNFEVRDGELYTNGYPLPLACYEITAIPEPQQMATFLSGIKTQRYNTVAIPHYPLPDEFYRLCDSIGLYVVNQADIYTGTGGDSRSGASKLSNDPRWTASFIDRAVTMYGTSATHPSLLMFSIARGSSNGYPLYKSYLALKAMEQDRPVIYPGSGGQWNTDGVTREFADRFPNSVVGRIILEEPLPLADMPSNPYTFVLSPNNGDISLNNSSKVTRLKGRIDYTVKRGRKVVSQGSIPVDVEPDHSIDLTIPVPEAEAAKKLKFEAVLVSNFDLL